MISILLKIIHFLIFICNLKAKFVFFFCIWSRDVCFSKAWHMSRLIKILAADFLFFRMYLLQVFRCTHFHTYSYLRLLSWFSHNMWQPVLIVCGAVLTLLTALVVTRTGVRGTFPRYIKFKSNHTVNPI